mmetsp:Transcript_21539/g.46586  ORF Transcript_21539/g.46586 Transcript_21539/m.46586 type:complete len:209 (-) Transcript_21539:1242-1868(-)
MNGGRYNLDAASYASAYAAARPVGSGSMWLTHCITNNGRGRSIQRGVKKDGRCGRSGYVGDYLSHGIHSILQPVGVLIQPHNDGIPRQSRSDGRDWSRASVRGNVPTFIVSCMYFGGAHAPHGQVEGEGLAMTVHSGYPFPCYCHRASLTVFAGWYIEPRRGEEVVRRVRTKQASKQGIRISRTIFLTGVGRKRRPKILTGVECIHGH